MRHQRSGRTQPNDTAVFAISDERISSSVQRQAVWGRQRGRHRLVNAQLLLSVKVEPDHRWRILVCDVQIAGAVNCHADRGVKFAVEHGQQRARRTQLYYAAVPTVDDEKSAERVHRHTRRLSQRRIDGGEHGHVRSARVQLDDAVVEFVRDLQETRRV